MTANHGKSSILNGICRELGVDPEEVIDGHIRCTQIQLTPDCRVMDVRGNVTVMSKHEHPVTYDFGGKTICPACAAMVARPDRQISGVSKCCGRTYCHSPDCRSLMGKCWACGEPTCASCAARLWSESGKSILVHQDCVQKLPPEMRPTQNPGNVIESLKQLFFDSGSSKEKK